MLKIIVIITLSIYGFIYLLLAAKTKRPFYTIFGYAFLGIIAIAVIDITSKFSGVYIPVNPYTVGTGAIFGLPGTVSLLLLKIIFVN